MTERPRKNMAAALRIKEALFNLYNNAAENGEITPSRDRTRHELHACESTVRTAEDMLVEEERIVVRRGSNKKYCVGGTILIVETGKETASNMGMGIKKARETARPKGPPPVKSRKCSCCHKKFKPRSKYLFRCDACKASRAMVRDENPSWLYV